MKRDFEFDGSGFGYLWLCIWTTVLTVITCGLFFPSSVICGFAYGQPC